MSHTPKQTQVNFHLFAKLSMLPPHRIILLILPGRPRKESPLGSISFPLLSAILSAFFCALRASLSARLSFGKDESGPWSMWLGWKMFRASRPKNIGAASKIYSYSSWVSTGLVADVPCAYWARRKMIRIWGIQVNVTGLWQKRNVREEGA